jgi:CheY-like chemotaxis protein
VGDEKKTVLLVDDTPDSVDILTYILEQEGYKVVTADNGEDALAQLREGLRPGLILLDLMMPRMNGFEFRAEQTRDPELVKIPIIVYSAMNGKIKEQAEGLGIEVFFVKPVDFKVLLDVVKRRCV